MAEERVFLNDDNVYISNTKVMLQGVTYATANITSVSKRFTPASRGCATILIVMGVLAILGGLATCGNSHSNDGAIGGVFVALLMIAGGVAWYRSIKPTFHVILASSSGESQGLSAKDQQLVDRVVAAVSDAITHRG